MAICRSQHNAYAESVDCCGPYEWSQGDRSGNHLRTWYRATALPLVILCHFPHYTGPSFESARRGIVALAPSTNYWGSKRQFSRTQFCLRLCDAMTIHKAQGFTLDAVVVDIGTKGEVNCGATFVALSRVRSGDSCLIRPVSVERLMGSSSGKQTKDRLSLEAKLALASARVIDRRQKDENAWIHASKHSTGSGTEEYADRV